MQKKVLKVKRNVRIYFSFFIQINSLQIFIQIQPLDPVDVDTYKLSEQEKRKFGIESLPTSLKGALNAFKSDNEFLKPVFDNDFLDMYYETLKKQL